MDLLLLIAIVLPCKSFPVSRPGYFHTSNGNELDVFVACPNANACLGGSRCAQGYEGLQCTQCAEGYYRLDGNRCVECPPASSALFAFLFVLAVLGCVGLVAALYVLVARRLRAEKTGTQVKDLLELRSLSLLVPFVQIVAVLGKVSTP